jgi:hypothetical protein
MRRKINLIGGGFQHVPSTSTFEPKYIEWVKGKQTSDISVYCDFSVKGTINPRTKNYGWLVESKTINKGLYEWCKSNAELLKSKFITVFTHDLELSKSNDIFTLTQCSGKSFLESGEVYPKNKLVSMIASNKRFCTEHQYRQQIIKKFSNKCDHFGRGFKYIEDKSDGLRDYCFSITMENATYSNMFTEKITDCFMTGTIPIYYGIKNIVYFFNSDGIITLTEDFRIEDLSFDLYNSKIEAVKENFRLANELLTAEDYLYINFIKTRENDQINTTPNRNR